MEKTSPSATRPLIWPLWQSGREGHTTRTGGSLGRWRLRIVSSIEYVSNMQLARPLIAGRQSSWRPTDRTSAGHGSPPSIRERELCWRNCTNAMNGRNVGITTRHQESPCVEEKCSSFGKRNQRAQVTDNFTHQLFYSSFNRYTASQARSPWLVSSWRCGLGTSGTSGRDGVT